MTFDEEWANQAIHSLRERGVEFTTGLSARDLATIEATFAVPLPTELATFLAAGLPVGAGWADWQSGASAVQEEARAWIDQAFSFDIENNGYWHPLFGERPADTAQAVQTALEVVRAAPPLIPIYGHRFLATVPLVGPRAVLSVWQAIDSVPYGNDLADYFANEFGIPRPAWAAASAPLVPVWEELFWN